MPLLWVLRDLLGSHGTKFGCGIGGCGACTMYWRGGALLRDDNARCCAKRVLTIEGSG